MPRLINSDFSTTKAGAEFQLKEKADSTTVFQMEPVIREKNQIHVGTYARIQHVLSRLYLVMQIVDQAS